MPRDYVSGESHYFWGRRYLLEVVHENRPMQVTLKGKNKIILQVPPDYPTPKREEVMMKWYRKELRQEAAEQFAAGGREERAADERAEIDVLEVYLPQMLSGDELATAVDEVIGELGASSMADMGNVMGSLMERYRGKIDGRAASEAVRERLST